MCTANFCTSYARHWVQNASLIFKASVGNNSTPTNPLRVNLLFITKLKFFLDSIIKDKVKGGGEPQKLMGHGTFCIVYLTFSNFILFLQFTNFKAQLLC